MKNKHKVLQSKRTARARRSRARIAAFSERPRISVFRSNKHISGQIIMPGGAVVLTVSDMHVKDQALHGVARAFATGKLLAERAQEKKIDRVVFDKGRYAYHGRVKAFADGAREGGLEL